MTFSTLGFLVMALHRAELHFDHLRREGAIGDWAWVGSLGILLAVYLPFYYAALRRYPIWRLRTIFLALPIVVGVLEIPLWGLELGAVQILGGAIVLAGIAILVQMERTDTETPGQSTTDE